MAFLSEKYLLIGGIGSCDPATKQPKWVSDEKGQISEELFAFATIRAGMNDECESRSIPTPAPSTTIPPPPIAGGMHSGNANSGQTANNGNGDFWYWSWGWGK